jgi:hypothetical protein
MKRTLAVTAMCVLAASSAAFADQTHDHPAPAAEPPAAKQGVPAGGMHMHEHMKMMKKQIGQIRAATDPQEKERLMNEHLKTMENAMAKMGGMGGCGKM